MALQNVGIKNEDLRLRELKPTTFEQAVTFASTYVITKIELRNRTSQYTIISVKMKLQRIFVRVIVKIRDKRIPVLVDNYSTLNGNHDRKRNNKLMLSLYHTANYHRESVCNNGHIAPALHTGRRHAN